jgi:hypothetical protein
MAIAKVGSTGSSSGAINYVLSENKEATKQPEILAGSFGTMAEIKKEFDLYNKLNSRVKNQATHISVSFALGERVKAEKKIEFAEKLLEKLDFKNVPFLVVEHFDKEYEHFHIIAGRIRDDGTTVKEWKIAERAIEATKELEKTLGLQRVEYTKSNDRRVKGSEYKQMERTNELSVLAEAKLVIDEILKDQPKTKEFVTSLQNFGFDVRPNISEKTGRMNGFSFKKDDIAFKSSSIAKNYSWQNLQKNGLNYEHARDTEFLIGVKNEFTKKLGIESGRNRDIENSESIVDRTKSVIDRTQSASGRAEPDNDRLQSDNSGSFQNKFESGENRDSGHTDSHSEIKSGEIEHFPVSDEASKQPAQTKISDGEIHRDGIRGKPKSAETNSRDNSGIGRSASDLIEINLTASTPKLNPAPEREADRTDLENRSREIKYDRGRSR